MSWKGFTKGVVRTPQTVKAKFNLGDNTKDAVYIDAERRFQELETETKRLHVESKKYFDSINSMLKHQIEFSKALAEIYKPISGRLSDPDSFEPEGNPEGIRACEEYEKTVTDLLETLQPQLEMIETRIIQPANELLEIIKVIRKTSQKRHHKQLDYDRHKATLQKLKEKKDRSLKDEKAMYKAENDVEQATQEFNYFNELLKDELPKLFALEREFIKPLFQSFYFMQLNIVYTLHERMQALNIGYFDFSTDIEEGFQVRYRDVKAQIESLSIVHFKTTGKRPGARFGQNNRLAIEGRPSSSSNGQLTIEDTPSSNIPNRRATHDFLAAPAPPPPYSATFSPTTSISRANSTGSTWAAAAKAKKAVPPPPKPKPKPLGLAATPTVPTATALYDYEAQAVGDLSFCVGDVIEIVQRGATENEWWTGRINGRTGQFPANYVRVN